MNPSPLRGKGFVVAICGALGLLAALAQGASAQTMGAGTPPHVTPLRIIDPPPLPPLPPAIVQTREGALRGDAFPGRLVFLGIPFAKPPTGALRWRPPQPVEPWTGVRDARERGAPCPQADLGWNRSDASWSREDCLYLDVATPARAGARLPVMVWIHGGANWAGSSGGTVLSGMTGQGVVLVAIQYRLGALGFLSHPALSAEQGGASGNYALMDQIAALKWVKANIEAFGGDPDNITIFGESAGGQDVGLLTLIPSTEGLFARAIQESGTAGFGLEPRSLKQNEAVGEEFAAAAGVAKGEGELAALRALTPQQILTAQARLKGPESLPHPDFVWLQAVVDGRVLPDAPAALLRSGRRLRPLLIGSNAQEIDVFRGADLAKAMERVWGRDGGAALALQGGSTDPGLGDGVIQAATDGIYRCPAAFTAGAFAASGAPVWLYQFGVPNRDGKVSHASELPFVFDGLPAGAPGVSLQAYWTNFARSGDPNGAGLPAWPAFGAERAYIDFRPDGPKAGRDPRAAVCGTLGRP